MYCEYRPKYCFLQRDVAAHDRASPSRPSNVGTSGDNGNQDISLYWQKFCNFSFVLLITSAFSNTEG